MADLPSGVDREVFDDLVCVEDCRGLFDKLGKETDFWEVLCIVKEDRKLLRDEVQRLTGLVQSGRAAGIARAILEKLKAARDRNGLMAQELQGFIPLVPGTPVDQDFLQIMVGFIMVSPKGREAASRWIADPARYVAEAASKLKAIENVVAGYHKALRNLRPLKRPPPPPKAEEPLDEVVFEAVAVVEEEPPAPAPFEVVPTTGVPTTAPDPFTPAAEPPAPPPPPAPAAPVTPAAPMPVFSQIENLSVAEASVPRTKPPPPAPAPEAAPPPPPKKTAPAPPKAVELPAGVDREVLDDVQRVEQCRKIFEVTHQQIEVWEVFLLVMNNRENTKASMEALLQMKDADQTDQFTEGALALFEKLLDIRAKHGRFVRQLREYVLKLPIGHFGKETTELALGFIVASSRGRQSAQTWLNAPEKFMAEASGRLEDIISRTMKYQTALRMMS